MTPPIQPGTARRLTLRTPQPTPTGILTVHHPVTEQQLQSIKERYLKGSRGAAIVIGFVEHHLDRTLQPWQREVIHQAYRGRG